MKTNLAAVFILSIGLISPVLSHADCSMNYRKVVSGESLLQYVSGCEIEVPLRMVRVTHDFPMMGSYEVDAWEGSWKRSGRFLDHYVKQWYDSCSGEILDETPYGQGVIDKWVSFDFKNPNLADEVSTSIKADAPFTDEEAKSAFTKTKEHCQKGTDGIVPKTVMFKNGDDNGDDN